MKDLEFLGVSIESGYAYYKDPRGIIVKGERVSLPRLGNERPGALIWTTIEGERHA